MDIQRCYAILELSEQAGPEELKIAYRRLAFACHPDLHPKDPQAAEKFRRLNEAYVTLREHLEAGEQAQPREGTGSQRPGSERAGRGRPHAASSRRGAGERTRTRPQGRPRSESASEASSGRSSRQEEILKNILKDPFAKQVFEEIFRTVKRTKPGEPGKLERAPSRKRLSLSWGSKTLELDLSRLSPSGLKKWLGSQLDHEQTLYLPPSRLLPGTSISITIRHGLRKGSETVSATIPPDYAAGRPLRLKGKGRRLGPWKGDLYLRLLTK